MKPMGIPTRADDLIASYSSKEPTLLDHIVKPDIVAPGNLMTSVFASSSATLVKTSPKNIVALSSYTANGKGTTWCGISGHPSGTVEHGSGAFDLWDCEVPGRNARQEREHLPGEWLFSALGWLDHMGNFRGLGHVGAWGTSARGESVLWGSSAPWGSNSDDGYKVLWGTSVVWGTSNENEAIPIELKAKSRSLRAFG
jgi:hypothetical protein